MRDGVSPGAALRCSKVSALFGSVDYHASKSGARRRNLWIFLTARAAVCRMQQHTEQGPRGRIDTACKLQMSSSETRTQSMSEHPASCRAWFAAGTARTGCEIHTWHLPCVVFVQLRRTVATRVFRTVRILSVPSTTRNVSMSIPSREYRRSLPACPRPASRSWQFTTHLIRHPAPTGTRKMIESAFDMCLQQQQEQSPFGLDSD